MRKYVSGTKWCVWRWTEVDSEYIRRLHILKTPWFAICLHWILKPDPDPYVHDHPVTFLSLILRGGYTEVREQIHARDVERTVQVHRWYNWLSASRFDRHRIIGVKPHTLTLCFMSSVKQQWGFHKPDAWQFWKDYYAAQRAAKAAGTYEEPDDDYTQDSAELADQHRRNGTFSIGRRAFYRNVSFGVDDFDDEAPTSEWDALKPKEP